MTPENDMTTFLQRFFGAPNVAWPEVNPSHPSATFLAPFLEAFASHDERPLILPRNNSTGVSTAYVICWNQGHANRIRPLLEAAVGHTWAHFTGRTLMLDPLDPLDNAVLDFVGPGTTFLLRPTPATQAPMWAALKATLTSLEMRRFRPNALPRPLGQLLWEFEAALSAGQADGAGRILAELDLQGGMSLENLAFLQMRRLSRLGLDHQLLNHRSIATVLESEPPPAIRDAILAAWFRQSVTSLGLETADEIDHGLNDLRRSELPIGLLVDGESGIQSDEAARAAALVAIVRDDSELARVLLGLPFVLSEALQSQLNRIGEQSSPTPRHEAESEVAETGSSGAPPSLVNDWVTWFQRLNSNEAASLSAQDVSRWPVPSSVDVALAEAIDAVSDREEDAVLSAIGPFLECDEFRHPAWRSAVALVQRMLIAERLSPEDQGSLQSLVEIILRSGPSQQTYADLLNDVQGFASRWVSAAFPDPAIDLVDCIAAGPRPDPVAATRFAAVLLEPIWAQRQRVPSALRLVAQMSTDDLSLGWDWTLPDAAEDQVGEDVEPLDVEARILLYSLDESVLKRSRAVLERLMPRSTIHCSSDKVGTPQLKSHARAADFVVLATRCAKHSATAFIVDNAKRATIAYADGAGSASMIRAFEATAIWLRSTEEVA